MLRNWLFFSLFWDQCWSSLSGWLLNLLPLGLKSSFSVDVKKWKDFTSHALQCEITMWDFFFRFLSSLLSKYFLCKISFRHIDHLKIFKFCMNFSLICWKVLPAFMTCRNIPLSVELQLKQYGKCNNHRHLQHRQWDLSLRSCSSVAMLIVSTVSIEKWQCNILNSAVIC